MFVQALLAFIALPGVVTIAFRAPGYVQVFTQGLFNHGFVALLLPSIYGARWAMSSGWRERMERRVSIFKSHDFADDLQLYQSGISR
jgi:hypothetical protein